MAESATSMSEKLDGPPWNHETDIEHVDTLGCNVNDSLVGSPHNVNDNPGFDKIYTDRRPPWIGDAAREAESLDERRAFVKSIHGSVDCHTLHTSHGILSPPRTDSTGSLASMKGVCALGPSYTRAFMTEDTPDGQFRSVSPCSSQEGSHETLDSQGLTSPGDESGPPCPARYEPKPWLLLVAVAYYFFPRLNKRLGPAVTRAQKRFEPFFKGIVSEFSSSWVIPPEQLRDRFACPYAKFEPYKYGHCLWVNTGTLDGMRYHIQSYHSKDTLPCQTWEDIFSTCYPTVDPNLCPEPYLDLDLLHDQLVGSEGTGLRKSESPCNPSVASSDDFQPKAFRKYSTPPTIDYGETTEDALGVCNNSTAPNTPRSSLVGISGPKPDLGSQQDGISAPENSDLDARGDILSAENIPERYSSFQAKFCLWVSLMPEQTYLRWMNAMVFGTSDTSSQCISNHGGGHGQESSPANARGSNFANNWYSDGPSRAQKRPWNDDDDEGGQQDGSGRGGSGGKVRDEPPNDPSGRFVCPIQRIGCPDLVCTSQSEGSRDLAHLRLHLKTHGDIFLGLPHSIRSGAYTNTYDGIFMTLFFPWPQYLPIPEPWRGKPTLYQLLENNPQNLTRVRRALEPFIRRQSGHRFVARTARSGDPRQEPDSRFEPNNDQNGEASSSNPASLQVPHQSSFWDPSQVNSPSVASGNPDFISELMSSPENREFLDGFQEWDPILQVDGFAPGTGVGTSAAHPFSSPIYNQSVMLSELDQAISVSNLASPVPINNHSVDLPQYGTVASRRYYKPFIITIDYEYGRSTPWHLGFVDLRNIEFSFEHQLARYFYYEEHDRYPPLGSKPEHDSFFWSKWMLRQERLGHEILSKTDLMLYLQRPGAFQDQMERFELVLRH